MPGWHETTKRWQEEGRLQLVGIVQEQHPERAALFMQWKRMGWPLLVDSYNLLGVAAVPITLGLDEHGVVRLVDPKEPEVERFLETSFPAPEAEAPDPELSRADGLALDAVTRKLGLADVIEAYELSRIRAPEDGSAFFRLGVAYRQRYDSAERRPGDFQRAVAHWRRALELDPNQYIWRRRIQQYGPRLDKPYPFYDWVAEARREIRARGEEPIQLAVEPAGAELAAPAEALAPAESAPAPDPRGRIIRDPGRLVHIETVVVPDTRADGSAARLHAILRPNPELKAHWNNEVDPLVVWIDPPAGLRSERRSAEVPLPPAAVSQETREVGFEILGPPLSAGEAVRVPGYALYYVCEDVNGVCMYRRQDLEFQLGPNPR